MRVRGRRETAFSFPGPLAAPEFFFGDAMKRSFAAVVACTVLGALPAIGAQIAGTPFDKREIVDSLGRTVTYYISQPKTAPAPVMLMLQGSGCVEVINEKGRYSTFYNLVPYAQEGRFTVVAVEKPFSGHGGKQRPGTAKECGAEFNGDFTAERWLIAIRAALADARKSPWVDPRRTLVFGVSEGAVMADMLAGRDPTVTDVIAIGGPGTTQLFSFVASAYQHCFDTAECLADIDRNVRDIRADPDSSTRFAWGHPYKRWSSFFAVDPAEELLRSRARVYIAFGTADTSTPALSEEIAVAKLVVAGRDVTVRRVPDAGHSLTSDVHPDYQEMDKEYRAALDWFWQGPAGRGAAR